jgi:hypothetical protein
MTATAGTPAEWRKLSLDRAAAARGIVTLPTWGLGSPQARSVPIARDNGVDNVDGLFDEHGKGAWHLSGGCCGAAHTPLVGRRSRPGDLVTNALRRLRQRAGRPPVADTGAAGVSPRP